MADIPNLELTYPINVAPLLFQSFVTFSLLSNLLNFRFWHKADTRPFKIEGFWSTENTTANISK